MRRRERTQVAVRSRKTSQTIKQDTLRSRALQRPKSNDSEVWKAYWRAQGSPWRTEPEIDSENQRYLATYRAITPDIERGIYPFKGIRLDRSDVEWLLATHENGRGPVDWSDESQQKREGLDLRGADLGGVDLSGLPLAGILGGLDYDAWFWFWHMDGGHEILYEAGIILGNANISEAHLEGASLVGAQLGGADFNHAYLEETCFNGARAEGANFRRSHADLVSFYGADLQEAEFAESRMQDAIFMLACLKRADFSAAHMEESNFSGANMELVNFAMAHLNNAIFMEQLESEDVEKTHLEGASFYEAHLEGATLESAYLGGKKVSDSDAEKVVSWLKRFPISIRPENTSVIEPVNFRSAFFDAATKLDNAQLGDDKYGYVTLADAHWGDVNISTIRWDKIKILGDEYEARRRMSHGQIKGRLHRLGESEIAVRANRQLAIILRNQGLNENAAHFAYHAQLMQRRVFWYQRKFGQYIFSLFLDLLSGYGYKPIRSFITYLIVIATFATAYFIIGQTAGPHLSPLGSVVFSMTSFHGRGFFPGGIGLDDPLTVVAAFEAFVGLLIEVTFIATLTQRLFGK